MKRKRLTIVVSPQSGTKRGLSVLDRVKPIFKDAGIELDICATQHQGHASEIAQSLDLTTSNGICVIGGDGTVHEVADGLMQRGESNSIPLGIIPAGTGNTLAEHLQCNDPLEAARRIVAGTICPLDVIRVTLKDRIVYCVDLIGWGAVADINCTAEKWRLLGMTRYTAATLWQVLRARRRRAKLVCWEKWITEVESLLETDGDLWNWQMGSGLVAYGGIAVVRGGKIVQAWSIW